MGLTAHLTSILALGREPVGTPTQALARGGHLQSSPHLPFLFAFSNLRPLPLSPSLLRTLAREGGKPR